MIYIYKVTCSLNSVYTKVIKEGNHGRHFNSIRKRKLDTASHELGYNNSPLLRKNKISLSFRSRYNEILLLMIKIPKSLGFRLNGNPVYVETPVKIVLFQAFP